MKSSTPRDLALTALKSQHDGPGQVRSRLETLFVRQPLLSTRDRALALHLVQGTLRWRNRLDWTIRQYSHSPFEAIEPSVLNILRIALYQILFLDRVPDSAAVNEAVKQARRSGAKTHVIRFVNGILRQVCRSNAHNALPDRRSDPVAYLSVAHSYPEWLVTKWIEEEGEEQAERLLAAGNSIPGVSIRVNRLKSTRERLARILEKDGVLSTPTKFSPDGLEIQDLKGPVDQLSAFKQGLFVVQGETAQVCSLLLNTAPGHMVLDVCAGKGGKATHVAEISKDMCSITAIDRNHERLRDLVKTSQRLGIGAIAPVVADASSPLSSLFRARFHRIIVDAPCSCLGVISKHPDGKWSRGPDDISRLAETQLQILLQASRLLRKGGMMLYVTCTISREENQGVIRRFIAQRKDIALEDIRTHAPKWSHDLMDEQGFLRTYPHVHGMDGFFAALLKRR